jgi:Cu/Ag efflux protein CusF
MIRARTPKSAVWVTLVAIAVQSACSDPEPTDHSGRGVAQEIDPVARTVTLDHEDIPGLMKGMTMTFAVAPGVELESIAAGSEVEFVLQAAGDALTVTRIEPVEK